MGLRPLYLASGNTLRVTHDGRALRVQAAGRAPAWYAYARLSRVVSATDVDWQAAALLACMGAGVPVCFLDGHGNPHGYCYGNLRRETLLDDLLAIALDAPDWEARFRHWNCGMHRQLMLQALTRAGLPARDLERPATVRSALCNAHHQRVARPLAPLLRQLEGALHAFTAEHLQQHVSAERLGHPRPGLCLVDQFSSLLRWPAFRLLERVDAPQLDATAPARLAASLLGDDSSLWKDLGALVLRFEHWLRSWAL